MNGWLDKKKHKITEKERKRLRKLERQKKENRKQYLTASKDLLIEIYGKTIEAIFKAYFKSFH